MSTILPTASDYFPTTSVSLEQLTAEANDPAEAQLIREIWNRALLYKDMRKDLSPITIWNLTEQLNNMEARLRLMQAWATAGAKALVNHWMQQI